MRKVLFLLGHLTDSDLEWLIARGEKQRVAAGTLLIREGDQIAALYLLLDGRLEVFGSQISGPPIRLGAGEIVGEMSLLDSRPPVANVAAVVDSVVLAIPRSALSAELTRNSEFAARFYRSMAVFLVHRLRSTYHRMGYGKGQVLDEQREYEDELSPELLDQVHLAASRFDRALQRLLVS
jgi:CRP-like cAMP-binding protein